MDHYLRKEYALILGAKSFQWEYPHFEKDSICFFLLELSLFKNGGMPICPFEEYLYLLRELNALEQSQMGYY